MICSLNVIKLLQTHYSACCSKPINIDSNATHKDCKAINNVKSVNKNTIIKTIPQKTTSLIQSLSQYLFYNVEKLCPQNLRQNFIERHQCLYFSNERIKLQDILKNVENVLFIS